MKTLVYFASGRYKVEYRSLNFDRIYIVDNCFKKGGECKIIQKGKITCVGMDCLESIDFLKNEGVEIDYFVSINEGLYEGGGFYPINSDFFLGYAMPLLKNDYIHIMNKTYYTHPYRITFDLPYNAIEITNNDCRYINPLIFSDCGKSQVFHMTSSKNSNVEILIDNYINIKVIHDSIWNFYDEMECVIISFSEQWQQNFFNEKRFPKLLDLNKITIDDVLDHCENNKIKKIGFTPWGRGKYKSFIDKLKIRKNKFPKEIFLFHLNKNDYQEVKRWKENGAERMLCSGFVKGP